MFKNLMNTRKMATTAIPKGVASIQSVMNVVGKTPYYLGKKLNEMFGGKRKTRKTKKSRKTRKHH